MNDLFSPKTIISFALGAVLFGTHFVIDFTEPTAAPPSNNVPAPLHTGSGGQSKAGGLILNTGGASNGLIVQSGNVGIGIAGPTEKLEVNGAISAASIRVSGEVKLGSSAAGCNTSSEGFLRYNPSIKNTEFCDGSTWRHASVCIPAPGSPVPTPLIDEDCDGVLDNNITEYLGHLWGKDGNYCQSNGTNCTSMCQTNSGNPNLPHVYYVPGTVDLCGGAGCQADCRFKIYY